MSRAPGIYRKTVFSLVRTAVGPYAPFQRVLDLGSGEGWFSDEFHRQQLAQEVTPLDVTRRDSVIREPILYDGTRIPYPDHSFDLVFAIDVLHHCPDPVAALDEMLRCSGRFLLLKDHTYRSIFGWLVLAGLDELGNRRFGVPSPHRYQRGWAWVTHIERRGFSRLHFVHPAVCDPRPPFRWLSPRHQFVGLWERRSARQ